MPPNGIDPVNALLKLRCNVSLIFITAKKNSDLCPVFSHTASITLLLTLLCNLKSYFPHFGQPKPYTKQSENAAINCNEKVKLCRYVFCQIFLQAPTYLL